MGQPGASESAEDATHAPLSGAVELAAAEVILGEVERLRVRASALNDDLERAAVQMKEALDEARSARDRLLEIVAAAESALAQQRPTATNKVDAADEDDRAPRPLGRLISRNETER